MKRRASRRQRGMLLLPVTLVLVVAGALAFAMTREGSSNVAAVDAEYDTENARYLAQAGVALARWQNEKIGCGSSVGFGTVTLPGGQIVAGNGNISWKSGNTLSVNLTATTDRGAVNTVNGATVLMHNFSNISQATIGTGTDAFINNSGPSLSNTPFIEVTDGTENGLMNLPLPGGLTNAMVLKAELKLYQYYSVSTQPAQSLSVQRVTTNWVDSQASWTSATATSSWNTPGGDYAPDAVVTVPISGYTQYVLRIDALVEGWGNGTLANQGFLLKPSGLQKARFYSFESSTYPPQLVVRYLPSC